MSTKNETKHFTVTLNDDDGYEQDHEVAVELTLELDSDYGADADGNRGMPTWFIEDWKIEEVDGQDASELDKSFISKIEDKISKQL